MPNVVFLMAKVFFQIKPAFPHQTAGHGMVKLLFCRELEHDITHLLSWHYFI